MGKVHFQYLDPFEAQDLNLEESVLKINRCAKVVKGGRRFSFSALSIVGNRNGVAGVGYAKAREVPSAIEKSAWDGRKHLLRIPLVGTTIPHEVKGRYRSSSVVLLPASQGTGIIAGASVRAVVELAGVRDILTKAHGSTNPINLVKAVFHALAQLRTKEQVAKLRGVAVE